MKWKLDRIISVATLLSSVIAIFLVLKKPQPVAPPMPPAAVAANAQSFQEKLQQLDQPKQPGQPPAQVRLTSSEVSAALAQATGAALGSTGMPASQPSNATVPVPANSPAAGPSTTAPSSADAPFAPGQPDVKDYQLNFDGDVARGQFLVNIGGRDVYVTLAGHLKSKDGYATFDATEFKVGELDIPVALVNEALQKKLEEQRDRLKLPNDVSDIKVENGELVMTQK